MSTKDLFWRYSIRNARTCRSARIGVCANGLHFGVRLPMLCGCCVSLNEVLRLKWTQVNLARKTITLYASKTERDRTVPISAAMVDVLKARKRDGLASDLHVFTRAV